MINSKADLASQTNGISILEFLLKVYESDITRNYWEWWGHLKCLKVVVTDPLVLVPNYILHCTRVIVKGPSNKSMSTPLRIKNTDCKPFDEMILSISENINVPELSEQGPGAAPPKNPHPGELQPGSDNWNDLKEWWVQRSKKKLMDVSIPAIKANSQHHLVRIYPYIRE